MSAGWVAGSVRARAIARRRVGADVARRMAACHSLGDALAMLAETSYRVGVVQPPAAARPSGAAPAGGPPGGGLPSGLSRDAGDQETLAAAQHAVNAAVLWDLRVLAGWLPQGGAQLMRTLAGWFEIANVAERMAEVSGRPAGEMFRLGALATAWPQLRGADTVAELRARLSASAWKDPGGDSAAAVEVGLRARWAQRVAQIDEPVRTWAATALLLLVAGERCDPARPDHPVLRMVAETMIGPAAANATTLEELARRAPRGLAWVLDGVWSAADLWRAEAAWWARTEKDGYALLAEPGFSRSPVIGAAAVLGADARRVGAALELAARGGAPVGAFDAVA